MHPPHLVTIENSSFAFRNTPFSHVTSMLCLTQSTSVPEKALKKSMTANAKSSDVRFENRPFICSARRLPDAASVHGARSAIGLGLASSYGPTWQKAKLAQVFKS